jgi:hypothetical protein
MTRQTTQITTTAQGATKRTYDKVLKRFSAAGILSCLPYQAAFFTTMSMTRARCARALPNNSALARARLK